MSKKIHPHLALVSSPSSSSSSSPCSSSSSPCSSSSSSSSSCSSPCSSSCAQQVFTIWMKSLVLGGKGCTVFDSNGQLVYRVDNYTSKSCHKVFLMDSHGRVLLTILRKRFRLLAHWVGYREEKNKGGSWWFQVRRSWKITKKPLECKINVNLDHDNESSPLKFEKPKSELSPCRIVDQFGGLLAEMKRKQSIGGVFLGNDVLTMVVEPNTDHYLIMGLLVTYSLIHSTI